jgi:[protein-PII] uridylyltransferase
MDPSEIDLPLPAIFTWMEGRGRSEAVQMVKGLRQREWAVTKQWQLDQVGEITGLDVSIRLSQATDTLVGALFDFARQRADAPAEADHYMALFATGGYGRGELNPHSDLDILVVVSEHQLQPWMRKVYEEFNTLLWDTGFKVGGAMRSLPELERIIGHDFVTATASTEQRCLWGDQSIQAEMRCLLGRFRQRRAKAFLSYKVEELRGRHSKAGASLFRMEPDLKTNPGCLRDLQLLMNISWTLCGERLLRGLSIIDGMERDDIGALYQANDLLLRLRSLQHFHHGRAQDVWTLRDQLRCARHLGYSGASRLRAVEVMMRDYYRLVRRVVQLVDLTVSHLDHHGYLGRNPVLIKSRRPLTKAFCTVRGQVYCSDQMVWQRPALCREILKMARAAQQSGVRFSYVLGRSMRANMSTITNAELCNPENGRLFMEILGDCHHLQAILTDLHDAEFLGTMVPEFGNITCLMQFDSYHTYTIDQHTLFAVGNLEQLWRGQLQGLPDMKRMLRHHVRRDLLTLALLMHDVGKYMGRGHSERGAVMVHQVARRLGLSEDDAECLYFLVRHHTDLSVASRSRDISDPVFLAGLAELIGNQFRLDMLYLLTYCDTVAVAPDILTGWQEQLLSDLYELLTETMAQAEPHSRPGIRARFQRALIESDIDEAKAHAWLLVLPDAYFYQAQSEEAVGHFRLCADPDQDRLGMHWDEDQGSVILDLILPDRTGSFAQACAVLSGRGLDIEDACIWSIDRHRALCRLRLEAVRYAEADKDHFWRGVHEHLAKALQEPQHANQQLDARRQRERYQPSAADSGFNDPSVKVDQRSSQEYSILDVQERDDVGLLSRLCHIIAENGCSIGFASITTRGDVALDVFYVQRDGQKLSDAEAADLQADIERAYNMRERAEADD